MSPHSRDLGKEVEANNLYNQDHKRAGKNHECYLPKLLARQCAKNGLSLEFSYVTVNFYDHMTRHYRFVRTFLFQGFRFQIENFLF